MSKILTIGSFKRVGERGSFQHYFTHTLEDGREVVLEACMAGYCVGIYNHKKDPKCPDLIGEKECTLMDIECSMIAPGFSMLSGEALNKAVEIANKKINESQ